MTEIHNLLFGMAKVGLAEEAIRYAAACVRLERKRLMSPDVRAFVAAHCERTFCQIPQARSWMDLLELANQLDPGMPEDERPE